MKVPIGQLEGRLAVIHEQASVAIKQRRESRSTYHVGEVELELKSMPCLSLMGSQLTDEIVEQTRTGHMS